MQRLIAHILPVIFAVMILSCQGDDPQPKEAEKHRNIAMVGSRTISLDKGFYGLDQNVIVQAGESSYTWRIMLTGENVAYDAEDKEFSGTSDVVNLFITTPINSAQLPTGVINGRITGIIALNMNFSTGEHGQVFMSRDDVSISITEVGGVYTIDFSFAIRDIHEDKDHIVEGRYQGSLNHVNW